MGRESHQTSHSCLSPWDGAKFQSSIIPSRNNYQGGAGVGKGAARNSGRAGSTEKGQKVTLYKLDAQFQVLWVDSFAGR